MLVEQDNICKEEINIFKENLPSSNFYFNMDDVKDTSEENISEICHEINHLIHFICKNVVGREEIVYQTIYAFLTGEHQLLSGRTGMAKSLLARQIFQCFKNATVYEKHLTKDTTPDQLFGAYDMAEMKHGKMFHNIQGSLVMADFAFLDEIFDANDMLLRSLLSLLNERKLINGEQIVNSPLNSVIAASNYIRVTEILEAVSDRFIYKSYIPENKNLYYQFSIDQIYGENTGCVKSPERRLDLKKLQKLKSLIKAQVVEIPDYILFLKNYIIRQFIAETKKKKTEYDFTISDRTAAKVQDLLRASALLKGRLVVTEEDLDELYYLICMVGKEEEKVRLANIISSTKRYFFQDKELLLRIFDLITIFRIIKSAKDPKSLVEQENFIKLIGNIEYFFSESFFKNLLRGLVQKSKGFMNKIRVHHNKLNYILEVFQESCPLLKEMATKKETLELIDGFHQDVGLFCDIYLQKGADSKSGFRDHLCEAPS